MIRSSIRWFVWKSVVLIRTEGGRERERKKEPAGIPCIPAGSVSVSGQAWVLAGDPTSTTSPTPCPDPVVHLSRWPEREEEEREGEMRSRLERGIFF
jgi:hypothetical protein